jgi:hypothetical protein
MTNRKILVGLVYVTFLGASVASAGIVDGLVASWSFDSDFTADNGGSAFDLTAVNGATAGESGGVFGGAAKFERSNEEYAYTTGNVLTQGGDHTYSAWYKCATSNIPTGERYQVLETAAANTIPAPTGDSGYSAHFGLRDGGEGDYSQVYTRQSGGSVHVEFSEGAGSTSWHNVIVTYDNDGGSEEGEGLHTVYIDGVQVATMENASPLDAVEALVIGGHRYGTGRNFDGLIDDVGFWSRILTSDEITSLQTNAIPEPTTLGLLGLGGLALLRRRSR